MRTPKLPLALLCTFLSSLAAFAAVEVTEQAGKVVVQLDGKPFTEYRYTNSPHPHLFPVLGPGGQRMTRSYPMESPAGEDHDHPHHRSLWFAHGDVNGVDFWAEPESFGGKPSKMPLGKIVHEKFLEVKGGDQVGVISSQNRWEAPDGTTPVTSVQTLRFSRAADGARVIDFEITLKAGDKPVVFGDTKEGTMAIRVAETMRNKPNKEKIGSGHLLSSEGQKDGDVWGKPANWVDYTGPVDGKEVGVAIFDHPANPRHPVRWHARDYGLFAANPFCASEMDKSLPKGSGAVTLAPGQSTTYKYRFLFHEGDTAAAKVAEHYTAYTK